MGLYPTDLPNHLDNGLFGSDGLAPVRTKNRTGPLIVAPVQTSRRQERRLAGKNALLTRSGAYPNASWLLRFFTNLQLNKTQAIYSKAIPFPG